MLCVKPLKIKTDEMNFSEKKLYHQIHPLKLTVDVFSGFFTTYLLWKHNVVWFLILFLLPSVLISWVLIKFANLEPFKDSAFGEYIRQYMTSKIEVIRLVGQLIMWLAAWYHAAVFIVTGIFIIIGAWSNGLLFKKGSN